MKRIVILTGSELRHAFFRKALAMAEGLEVAATYCEGTEKSLRAITEQSQNSDADSIEMRHVKLRERSEMDFFSGLVSYAPDASNPAFIRKGEINTAEHAERIIDLNPDLLVAYGCSLIREPLLSKFQGRFLNVHLGLSPYYRGAGTNFWPLVNGEPEFVGATFMHIDAGVDTGEVIHQVRAQVFEGDSPHDIGNRLIVEMTGVYAELVRRLDKLAPMAQIPVPENERVYKRKDYNEDAARRMYRNFDEGLVAKFLATRDTRCAAAPIIEQPSLIAR